MSHSSRTDCIFKDHGYKVCDPVGVGMEVGLLREFRDEPKRPGRTGGPVPDVTWFPF